MSVPPKLLVIAPHPDDETLGPGGTLLRRHEEGWEIHWLIVTTAAGFPAFDEAALGRRAREIVAVRDSYQFTGVHEAAFPTTKLDTIPESALYTAIADVVKATRPDEVLLPFHQDPHSDHRIVATIGWSACKSFRAPSIKRVLMYETPSETEFALPGTAFRPNYLVEITGYLERKLEIMTIYQSEWGEHPFPRSPDNLRAHAVLHGATAGCQAAEGFVLVQDIDRLAG